MLPLCYFALTCLMMAVRQVNYVTMQCGVVWYFCLRSTKMYSVYCFTVRKNKQRYIQIYIQVQKCLTKQMITGR